VIGRDILENQAKIVYLGIGSNLGNKKNNIEKAKYKIHQNDIKILKCSSYYESLSWPNPKKPKFLNIVLKICTKLKPIELLKICKEIETSLGRKKNYKNAPRECDIDIIDYHKIKSIKEISLPHSRMHSRNFVLIPLFEIDKDWIHPISRYHIKKLILLLPYRDITSIKKI
tara:strand:+ start:1250 stop:1762 length:513 start_codon:yes stop_codon:yes gene_type:complete